MPVPHHSSGGVLAQHSTKHTTALNSTKLTTHPKGDKGRYDLSTKQATKLLNSTQQRTMDAGVWHLQVRIVIIYYHKLV